MLESRFIHYKTGVVDIDAEHWALFQELVVIEEALKKQEYIGLHLELFRDHLELHFDHENRIMAVSQYIPRKYHIAEHNRLLLSYAAMIRNIPNSSVNEITYSLHVLKELNEVILVHIDQYDMQMANFILSK